MRWIVRILIFYDRCRCIKNHHFPACVRVSLDFLIKIDFKPHFKSHLVYIIHGIITDDPEFDVYHMKKGNLCAIASSYLSKKIE
jgi:hypothetical protein